MNDEPTGVQGGGSKIDPSLERLAEEADRVRTQVESKVRIGRPPVPDYQKAKAVTVSMKPESADLLRETAASRELPQGEFISRLVVAAHRAFEKEAARCAYNDALLDLLIPASEMQRATALALAVAVVQSSKITAPAEIVKLYYDVLREILREEVLRTPTPYVDSDLKGKAAATIVPAPGTNSGAAARITPAPGTSAHASATIAPRQGTSFNASLVIADRRHEPEGTIVMDIDPATGTVTRRPTKRKS